MRFIRVADIDGPAARRPLWADPATSAIAVILLTPPAQPSGVEHYRSPSARGVIAKPFDPTGLGAQLKRAVGAPGAEPAPFS